MGRTRLNLNGDCPPMPYLEQVLNHCPYAGSAYLWLWRHQDDNHICHIRASEIAQVTMISKAKFKNQLRDLCVEGLLSFDESDDILEVELTGWDDDE